MKSKRKVSLTLLIILVLVTSVMLVACNAIGTTKTPQQLIEEAYGNNEYTISFSSETLDVPLEDMIYSANQIPKLPTPQKVGYIFEGWYLDSDFVMPYSDGILYLYMKDLTLYPKWSKETFLHNGTYDIEFESSIVDGSIKKGQTTDKYAGEIPNGFRDISKHFIKDACCIEKNEDNLLLKLQFDSLVITPFQSAGDVYNVQVSNVMGPDVYVQNRISSWSETVKTIFINLNSVNLSDTIYLDIKWTNFENNQLTEENRYDTTTEYQIAVDLTKIIGFSQPFVDTSVPLEEGYYLAKSFSRKEDNDPTMGQPFNPTYSYLYSDGNENYKFIMQNTPYLGLVALKHPLFTPITDNYYDFMLAASTISTVFDIDRKEAGGAIESDYYPFTYNGGKYRKTVTEFHGDTGKIYNIIDLDKDLSREYLALTAVSGYMEREGGMGYVKQIISIDYQNLIKLPEVDYIPLEGDSFEYCSEFPFYPGGYEDLDQKNLTFDVINSYGTSIDMPIFYYEASAQNADLRDRKILSSRIEVTPTKKTSGLTVRDSRYIVGEFDVNTKVYGYDVKNGNNLYIDKLSPQSVEALKAYNYELREVEKVKVGKSVKVGDEILLDQLFNEKVNKEVKFDNVKFKVYPIENNKINFDKQIFVENRKIEFTRDVAVEYQYVENGYINKTIVELKQINAPNIKINDDGNNWYLGNNNHYQKSNYSYVGDEVSYPKVTYTWGEKTGTLVSDFYDSNVLSVNPARTMIFGDRGGYYLLYLSTSHSDKFIIPERSIFLMYEIRNEFGERDYLYFDYNSKPKKSFIIKDQDGNIIKEDNLSFDKNGVQYSTYYNYTDKVYYDQLQVSDIHDYTHTEGTRVEDYKILSYDIYSNNGQQIGLTFDTKDKLVTDANEFLNGKDYGCVRIVYGHDWDRLEVDYLYNITFNGLSTYQAIDYDAYFTATPYRIPRVNLVGSNKQPISTLQLSITKYVDNRPVKGGSFGDCPYTANGNQYELIFNTPGTYEFTFTYNIPTNYMGNPNERYLTLEFYQRIEVKSNLGDIEITFRTSERNKFSDGTTEKIVKFNLAEGIYTPKAESLFKKTEDKLVAWSTDSNLRGNNYNVYEYIPGDEFINEYNSAHITLYAIWEFNSTVYCKVGDKTITTKTVYDKYEKSYKVTFPNITNLLGEHKHLIGWTGGFIKGLCKDSSYNIAYNVDFSNEDKYVDYFTIEAVIKEEYKVKFTGDASIAWLPRAEYVLYGEMVKNPEEKMNLIMKDSSYRLVGYYDQDDPEQTIVDLRNAVITKHTTFVAKFEKV